MSATTKTRRLLAVAIRPYTVADLHRVIHIADGPPGEGWGWPELKKAINRSGAEMLVAESDRGVVGFVVVQPTPGCVEVVRLGVCPSARRKGVGSILLAAACGEAARQGKGVGCVVPEHNDPVIGLLARSGFRGELRRKFYRDGGDAIRFTLAVEMWK